MGHQKYLFKKSGNFYFRRRVPGFSTLISPLMLSLGTKNEVFAYTCLTNLTVEFEDMLDAFLFPLDELPENLIASYMSVRLGHAISDLRRAHRMERVSGRVRKSSPHSLKAQTLALEILLQDGIQKTFPPYRIRPDWTDEELRDIMLAHRIEAELALSPALRTKLAREFLETTGVSTGSLEHHAQILEIYLHAKIASLNSLDDQRIQRSAAFRRLSEKLIEQSLSVPTAYHDADMNSGSCSQSWPNEQHPRRLDETKPADAPDSSTVPVLTPGVELINSPLTISALNAQFAAAAACDEPLHRGTNDKPFGVDIAGACERSIKVAMAAGKIDQKTADGRRSKIKLFCLLANVQTVKEIEQFHLRVFEQNLENVPLNFNKSHKDADLTLKQIINKAGSMTDEELGRSVSTFNAHLEMIGAVLKHARALERSAVDPTIDIKLARRREDKRARRKRNTFRAGDVKQLFQHTVWSGCKSPDRRHEVGTEIVKDGLYFVPLIVAYTGGRMEEIAGLPSDGIVPTDGHYGFDIRPHEERRLKNLQSERLVPVHDHLIALGLLEHQKAMQKQGQKYLFPELLPTSAKKKFQSALRYNWRKLREIQLEGNPRDIDGHSLRHAFNHRLKLEESVMREVRLDILGHAGIDLNEETYGDEDGMPFHLKKAAIDLLPRVF